MKKSLLALAVLGAFAGTASAQSSVTIYGLRRPGHRQGQRRHRRQPRRQRHVRGLDKCKQVDGLASRLPWQRRPGWRPVGSVPDRTPLHAGRRRAQPTPFWDGRSYVQLTSAAAGSVYLGREYTPAFWIVVKSDPFGWDGVGQSQHRTAAAPGFADTATAASSVRTSQHGRLQDPEPGRPDGQRRGRRWVKAPPVPVAIRLQRRVRARPDLRRPGLREDPAVRRYRRQLAVQPGGPLQPRLRQADRLLRSRQDGTLATTRTRPSRSAADRARSATAC